MDPTVTKSVEAASAYYLIKWSRLEKCNKYRILAAVPAMAGIYELYYEDRSNSLHLFYLGEAWFGGIRTALREKTDPELTRNEKRARVLKDFPCYYRYSVTGSHKDMADIIFFFSQTYRPESRTVEDSGRYADIYVREESDDRITDI